MESSRVELALACTKEVPEESISTKIKREKKKLARRFKSHVTYYREKEEARNYANREAFQSDSWPQSQ